MSTVRFGFLYIAVALVLATAIAARELEEVGIGEELTGPPANCMSEAGPLLRLHRC